MSGIPKTIMSGHWSWDFLLNFVSGFNSRPRFSYFSSSIHAPPSKKKKKKQLSVLPRNIINYLKDEVI